MLQAGRSCLSFLLHCLSVSAFARQALLQVLAVCRLVRPANVLDFWVDYSIILKFVCLICLPSMFHKSIKTGRFFGSPKYETLTNNLSL